MKKSPLSIRWVPVAIALLAAGVMLRVANASADASFATAGAPPAGYRVVLADLDLQSASGVDALYSRLQTAAREVCGYDRAHGFAGRRQARRCVSATLDAVVAELGRGTSVSGRLSAQHRAARNQMMETAPAERYVSRVN